MRKALLPLLFALVAVLALTACHKGGSSETPAATTNPDNTNPTTNPGTTTNPPTTTPAIQVFSGVFVDQPVEGLTFISGAQTGTTDAAGAFKYEAGGTVQFRLGNVILGQAPGKALITPVDLVQAIDSAATITDPRVVQIAQFLMTVNANLITDPTMSMSSFAATNAASVTSVQLSATPLDQASLTGLLGAIVPAKILVTPAEALAHLQTAFATLAAPKSGVFAALDSTANPQPGLRLTVTPNQVGDAFNVGGVAVSFDGSTWNIAGTLTLNGSLQAFGGGNGTPAPANMTITGSVASATQLTASVSVTLNNVPKQFSLVLEKATAPAAASNLALAADPGVTNATQIQHIAADLRILADGQINGHIVEGEETGLPLAVSQGGRYATLTGVVTSTGNVIAMGGLPGTSETFLSRSTAPAPSVVFLTGTANIDGTVSATVKSSGLTTGALTIPPLSFVTATNPFVGLYVGKHTDPKPVPPDFPSTVAFGVNNNGSAHGYARFFVGRVNQPESDDLLDGTVDAGGVLGIPPAPFPPTGLNAILGNPGVPGLVMTNDDGATAPQFPGSMGGTITAGSVTGGAWTTGPVIASGT